MINETFVVPLYRLYAIIVKIVRCNGFVFKLLFGYPPPESRYDNYWDWTTLIIKQHLTEFIKKDMSILDMGTGPYGVLAYYIHNNYPECKITAADYCPELLVYARQFNPKAHISFVESDLFDTIQGIFDLIIFNAPYISEDKGKALGVTREELSEKRWQGGQTGSETIEKFLHSSPEHLSKDGIILLGVNHFYLKQADIKQFIEQDGFNLCKEYKNNLTQAGLYAIRRKLL